mmetsp:Transcript_32072/g.73789  ORF Transcript_32072/g.73789 Transcript_32072/m.73789 type:complete len:233 (+) Transcript_32072:659-1357(+)
MFPMQRLRLHSRPHYPQRIRRHVRHAPGRHRRQNVRPDVLPPPPLRKRLRALRLAPLVRREIEAPKGRHGAEGRAETAEAGGVALGTDYVTKGAEDGRAAVGNVVEAADHLHARLHEVQRSDGDGGEGAGAHAREDGEGELGGGGHFLLRLALPPVVLRLLLGFAILIFVLVAVSSRRGKGSRSERRRRCFEAIRAILIAASEGTSDATGLRKVVRRGGRHRERRRVDCRNR